MKRMFKMLLKTFNALFCHEQWNIGLVEKPIWSFLNEHNKFDVQWLAEPKRNEYFADPFGAMVGNKLIVLFERFSYFSFKGSIARAEVRQKKLHDIKENVLKISKHASYPHIFYHKEQVYCIPEVHQKNSIELFKAKNKDLSEWERIATIIENFPAVDPTIVRHNGRWWLFCTHEYREKNAKLFIFYADNLRGPWQPHSKNPVKSSLADSRPAGTPFIYKDCLYRPAQDCRSTYGGEIAICKITELSPDNFREEVARKITSLDKRFPCGIHTLSSAGKFTLIDAKKNIFSIGAFFNVFRRNILKLYKTRKNGRILKSPERKVLILGEDTRSFLAVIRSFGRKNFEVHVGWCPKGSLALHSKYISKVHEIPEYSPNDDSWMKTLIKILKLEKFDLVIPCNDQCIIPLQKNRRLLEPMASIYLLDDATYDIAFNKIKMNSLVKSLGINFPKDLVVSNADEIKYIMAELSFPMVLKPEYSFSPNDLKTQNIVKIVNNREELEICLKSMALKGRVSAQEFFIGRGVGIELLAKNGKILAAFQHERVHEPLFGGGSSYRKSVDFNHDLLQAAEKIIQKLNYSGVAMVEFKVDKKNRKWAFMEINSRFWGSLPLAIAAGVDFPFYLYQLMVGGKNNFNIEYKKGIYCRNWWLDANWFKNNLKADKNNPNLITLSNRQVFKEFLNVMLLKEKSDTFVADDPAPGLIELYRLIKLMLNLAISKTRLFLSSLSFVKKRHIKNIIQNFNQAKSVLFVCKGNICRSPFAENCAKRLFTGSKKIISGGYFPETGRSCPPEVVKTAGKFNCDLSGHRSLLINSEMVAKAGCIFIFDEDDYAMLIAKYPSAKSKIFYLGFLSENNSIIIRDPFGKTLQDFNECYESINKCINNIYAKQHENIANQ